MTLTVYRVTNPGDVITTPSVEADSVVFNETVNVKEPNAFITTYDISTTIGIGNNQAAQEDLGDHQDLGAVENLYILRGFISQRGKVNSSTDGENPFMKIIQDWDEQNKTNTNFKHGRFGIEIKDMPLYDIVPTGTGTSQIGLIWKGIYWTQTYEAQPFSAYFEAHLIVDKGDDN